MKVRKDNALETQPVSGTVTANIGTVATLATAAKQDTGNTSLATLAGAVAGTEVQVDVLTMPTTTVQATNLDIRDLAQATDNVRVYANTAKDGSGTGYVPLVDTDGHLQIDVLSMPAGGSGLTDTELRATPVPVSVSGVSTAANQTTIIGHVDGIETLIGTTNSTLTTIDGRVDGIEGLLGTIDTDTGGIATSAASIDTKTPALGQALAAASVPVVLTAAQVTTLTPPAAITGFATSAKQDTIIGHVDGVETLLGTIDADTSTLAATDFATSAKQDDIITAIGGISGGGTQYDVDDVAGATDTGTLALLVRDDTLATLTPADGDYTQGRTNSRGAQWVVHDGEITAALSATDNAVLDTIDAVLDTIKVDTEAIETAVEAIQAAQLPDGHNVTVDNASLAVTGTFWQATQPISHAALTELAAAINSDKVDVNIVSSGISLGGTSAADDDDFTDGTTPGTPAMGVYEATPSTVTDGDLGVVGITEDRRLKTSAVVTSMPTTTVQATNLDIRDLTNADVVTAELSATDNAVLDAIAASVAAIDVDATTIIGHVDGIETLLGTIDGDTGNIATDVDTVASAVATISSTPLVRMAIFDDNDAQITSFGGGTEYDENAATPATPKGATVMIERDDALSTPVAEGDWMGLKGDANGALWVSLGTQLDSTNDSISAVQSGTWNVGLSAGTNGIGKLTANSGVDIGDVDVTSITGVTMSNAAIQTTGDEAHDAADAGNPVKIGYKAESSPKGLTLVADGDRTDAYADLDGIAMVKLNTSNADIISESVSNTDGSATAFSNFGAVASTKNYVTAITVYNSSATPGFVIFTDGSGGTTKWTMPLPAGGGSVISSAMPLFSTSANTALYFDVSGALSTVYISVSGFQSKA